MYSFIIPCYKSKETIGSVCNDIVDVMTNVINQDYEIICVNDFPFDNTSTILREIAANNKKIKVMELSRNFGQHNAIMAGLKESKGDYIVCLDDDGQTSPHELPKLIAEIDKYDVVFAKYDSKKHSMFRNFGSYINDRMACILIGKPKDLYISSYFIAKRFVIDEICAYTKPYTYMSGLLLRTSGFVGNAIVEHKNREFGESNYSLKGLLSLWLNGFTAFSILPLRLATMIGGIVSLLGFIMTIYSMINYFIRPNVPMGWTSTIAVISFIGGIILLVLGMIGEYIGRIYLSINKMPQYVVREKINVDEK